MKIPELVIVYYSNFQIFSERSTDDKKEGFAQISKFKSIFEPLVVLKIVFPRFLLRFII